MGMHISTATTHSRMVVQAHAFFAVVGLNPCQRNATGGTAGMCT